MKWITAHCVLSSVPNYPAVPKSAEHTLKLPFIPPVGINHTDRSVVGLERGGKGRQEKGGGNSRDLDGSDYLQLPAPGRSIGRNYGYLFIRPLVRAQHGHLTYFRRRNRAPLP